MEQIGSIIAYIAGIFMIPIVVGIVEYIINKSNGNKWGYTITKTVLGIELLVIFVTKFNSYLLGN